MSDSNTALPAPELSNPEPVKNDQMPQDQMPQEQKGGKVRSMKNKKSNKKTMKNKKSNKKTMKKPVNSPMKWTDFVTKIFRDTRKTKPEYQFKQALKDATIILKKNKK